MPRDMGWPIIIETAVAKRNAPAHIRKKRMRIYVMSSKQEAVAVDAVNALCENSGEDEQRAMAFVERHCVNMLRGRPLAPDAPRALHDIREAFPILTERQLAKLPVFGCPSGRIDAIVIPMRALDGSVRKTLYCLNRGQRRIFNDAFLRLAHELRSRDAAWVQLSSQVALALSGASVPEAFGDDAIWFQPLTIDEVMELPEATTDDLVRWCYRREA